jgi:hypothetical protein
MVRQIVVQPVPRHSVLAPRLLGRSQQFGVVERCQSHVYEIPGISTVGERSSAVAAERPFDVRGGPKRTRLALRKGKILTAVHRPSYAFRSRSQSAGPAVTDASCRRHSSDLISDSTAEAPANDGEPCSHSRSRIFSTSLRKSGSKLPCSNDHHSRKTGKASCRSRSASHPANTSFDRTPRCPIASQFTKPETSALPDGSGAQLRGAGRRGTRD